LLVAQLVVELTAAEAVVRAHSELQLLLQLAVRLQ
jgi:hypothetical protein